MVCRAPVGRDMVRLISRSLLAAAIVVATASSVSTDTFSIFGPRVYTRSTGAPVTVRESFPVLDTLAQCSQRMAVDRVTSTVVSLNGTQMLGPSDFNGSVRLIENVVELRANNELAVQVRGPRGGTLTIEVLGIDDKPPGISASTSPPPNANGWSNSNVTVTFACADTRSGVATCPTPVTVATQGANQVVSGTAADKAGTGRWRA